jgi:predicted kinase
MKKKKISVSDEQKEEFLKKNKSLAAKCFNSKIVGSMWEELLIEQIRDHFKYSSKTSSIDIYMSFERIWRKVKK